MRRAPSERPENKLSWAIAEIERLKALTTRITDGRSIVFTSGGTGDPAPGEVSEHVLYGSKHTRSLRVTAADGVSLQVNIEQGQVWINGVFTVIAAGSLMMVDATTNYVFVGSAGVVTSNTTGFPDNSITLATVVTAGGDISSVNDRRSYLTPGIHQPDISLGNPLIVGVDDTTRGEVHLMGDGAASTEGGAQRFFLAADHDAAFEYWEFEAFEDDFRILRSTGEIAALINPNQQLQLPATGSLAGVLLGGDVQLYRGAANALFVPDLVEVGTGLAQSEDVLRFSVERHHLRMNTTEGPWRIFVSTPSGDANDHVFYAAYNASRDALGGVWEGRDVADVCVSWNLESDFGGQVEWNFDVAPQAAVGVAPAFVRPWSFARLWATGEALHFIGAFTRIAPGETGGSPLTGHAVTVDKRGGSTNFRLRGSTGNERYRSDWKVDDAAGMSVNAFDDTGGVFLPYIFDFGTNFIIRQGDGGVNKLRVTPTEVIIGVAGSAPRLQLEARDGVDEGGEMLFHGAGAWGDWTIDQFQDQLRMFFGVTNRFRLNADGQLQLPTAGAGAGILLGGNVQLYHSAANVLTVPDQLTVQQQTLGNEVQRFESIATNDDPRESVFQNRAATTDATVTTLHTVTIPASTTMFIEAKVVARRTGGTAGTAEDGAAYIRRAAVKDVAGTATIIGAVQDGFTAEDQAGWDCTIDVTGTTARIRVTGALDNNITWHLSALRLSPVGS